METHYFEASNGFNHGKFLLCRFDEADWQRRSALPGYESRPLLAERGWTPRHVWMLDLQTGEGAMFLPGGHAAADLDKHKVWVCPLYQPALEWLYRQDLTGPLSSLPAYVSLPDAEPAIYGHRRSGPPGA